MHGPASAPTQAVILSAAKDLYAIRLGIALALATALYQIFHLPLERGYWIPMTVVLVLRSDFLTTFTRGIARLLGTMLGAVLTTLLLVFLAPSQLALVAIIALAANEPDVFHPVRQLRHFFICCSPWLLFSCSPSLPPKQS